MTNLNQLQKEIDELAARMKAANRETLESYQRQAQWKSQQTAQTPPAPSPESAPVQPLSMQQLYQACKEQSPEWHAHLAATEKLWTT
jgi:hypothetical protein